MAGGGAADSGQAAEGGGSWLGGAADYFGSLWGGADAGQLASGGVTGIGIPGGAALQGASDRAAQLAQNAVSSAAESYLMGLVDDTMSNAPGEGELFTWVPPHALPGGGSTGREIGLTPTGKLVALGLAGAFLFWMVKG